MYMTKNPFEREMAHPRCVRVRAYVSGLECFAAGKQVFPHRASHPYRVMDHVTTPILDEDWGAGVHMRVGVCVCID